MWKNKLYLILYSAILAVVVFGSAALPVIRAADQSTTIPNPLGSTQDFPTLLNNIARAIVVIVLPLSVVAIIWAGFKFVTSSASGNTKGVEEARKMLTWIIIGTVIIVGASVLARAIINFAKNL